MSLTKWWERHEWLKNPTYLNSRSSRTLWRRRSVCTLQHSSWFHTWMLSNVRLQATPSQQIPLWWSTCMHWAETLNSGTPRSCSHPTGLQTPHWLCREVISITSLLAMADEVARALTWAWPTSSMALLCFCNVLTGASLLACLRAMLTLPGGWSLMFGCMPSCAKFPISCSSPS